MSTGIKQFDGVLQFAIMVRLHKRGGEKKKKRYAHFTCLIWLQIPITWGFLPIYNRFFLIIISFYNVRENLNLEAYRTFARIQGTLLSHQHLHEVQILLSGASYNLFKKLVRKLSAIVHKIKCNKKSKMHIWTKYSKLWEKLSHNFCNGNSIQDQCFWCFFVFFF